MHTLLTLSSLLLVLFGSLLLLSSLHSLHDWSQRRIVQLSVLAMPSVILGLGMSGWHHFVCHICFVSAPLWDILLGAAIPVVMTGIALGAIVLGLLRLFLMSRVVRRNTLFVQPDIQTRADELGQRLHVRRARVFLRFYDQPLAFTCGIFRPMIVLSTWMVEHLDQREIEAVLAHEMEHVARHDYLVVWLSMILRDAFFYVPTCHIAYRQLQHEKELACDDLAVRTTRRPLALASALAKVWQNVVTGPTLLAVFGSAQSLVKGEEFTHRRIERLLSVSPVKIPIHISHPRTLGTKVFALGILLLVQCINVVIMVALMGHNPLLLLEKML